MKRLVVGGIVVGVGYSIFSYTIGKWGWFLGGYAALLIVILGGAVIAELFRNNNKCEVCFQPIPSNKRHCTFHENNRRCA